jgi:hypothetical protein
MWFDFPGNPHLTPKDVSAQFVDGPVVVVSHVSVRLAQFLADLY